MQMNNQTMEYFFLTFVASSQRGVRVRTDLCVNIQLCQLLPHFWYFTSSFPLTPKNGLCASIQICMQN